MRRTFPSFPRTLLAGAVLAALGACASHEEIPELQQAQAVVAQVQTAPLRDRAAENVNEALNALTKANKAAADGDDLDKIRHLAYVARRNAEIANEKILAAKAQQTIEQAEVERQQALAKARAQELQRAQQQLGQARAEAQHAAQRRDALKRELESMRELNAQQTDRGLVLTLSDVLFDVDKATLKPGAMRTMDRLAEFLKQHDERSIVVEGHTDSTGAESYNMDLSRDRANAVRTALLERGVATDKIQAIGKGEAFPIANNATVVGRQENRRVEIVLAENSPRMAKDGEE